MICQWCEEPIEEDALRSPFQDMHRECGYRLACGSLAHLQRRCSCMTKREAARAAWDFGILLDTVRAARTASPLASSDPPDPLN